MSAPVTPQSLVEHALATSVADDTVVIVRDATSANLRWANNTLTTNGVMHGIQVTVIAFVRQAGGTSVGSVSGSASTQAQVTELVDAANAAARAAGPAEDANELVRDRESADWDLRARAAPTSRSTTPSRPRWARRSGARAARAGCSTASSTTRSPRPTSAPRPACGCGTSSPPVTGRAPASPPT